MSKISGQEIHDHIEYQYNLILEYSNFIKYRYFHDAQFKYAQEVSKGTLMRVAMILSEMDKDEAFIKAMITSFYEKEGKALLACERYKKYIKKMEENANPLGDGI